jgi:hypothetical protein
MKICRFPIRCPVTYPTRTTPETAIRTFLPRDITQNLPATFGAKDVAEVSLINQTSLSYPLEYSDRIRGATAKEIIWAKEGYSSAEA